MFNRLISVFKTPVIEFLCEEHLYGVIPHPQPAKKVLPRWFKSIPGYANNGATDMFGQPAMTAKKCLPMIDAMSIGFIIPLMGDQGIRSNDNCTEIIIGPTSKEFPKIVERHDISQVGYDPLFKSNPIKFINPWVIKTAPGWSTLFVPCINHLEQRFTLLSGMVDTDRYPKQVNFPGTWDAPNFDDVLLAGTPLMTAIPLRRADIVTQAPVRHMRKEDVRELNRIHLCQQNRKHYYTHELREKR